MSAPIRLDGLEIEAIATLWARRLLSMAKGFEQRLDYRLLSDMRTVLDRLDQIHEVHENRYGHTTQDKDHGQQAKEQGGKEACD